MLSEEESFQHGLYYFRQALSVMAAGARDQCEMMGNYNVAWELRDDVLAGQHLLKIPGNRFTSEQVESMRNIFEALQALDESDLSFSDTPEGSIAAMRHPSWKPIRGLATELIEMLPLSEYDAAVSD